MQDIFLRTRMILGDAAMAEITGSATVSEHRPRQEMSCMDAIRFIEPPPVHHTKKGEAHEYVSFPFWCGRRDSNPHTTEVTEPKSVESTNSTTPANMSGRASCRYFVVL